MSRCSNLLYRQQILIFSYLSVVQIQNLEAENYTLQENLSTANNTIEEHKQKEKDFEENVNGLTHKVSMLEKAEEDYQVCVWSVAFIVGYHGDEKKTVTTWQWVTRENDIL